MTSEAVQKIVVEKKILHGADYKQTLGNLVEYGKYDGVNLDVLIPGRFRGCSHRQFSNEVLIVGFDRAACVYGQPSRQSC